MHNYEPSGIIAGSSIKLTLLHSKYGVELHYTRQEYWR